MNVPECHDDVCVTCSDQAIPVTVVRLLDDELALVRTQSGSGDSSGDSSGGKVEEVSVALVDARVGDTVLVHASEAIAVLGGDQR